MTFNNFTNDRLRYQSNMNNKAKLRRLEVNYVLQPSCFALHIYKTYYSTFTSLTFNAMACNVNHLLNYFDDFSSSYLTLVFFYLIVQSNNTIQTNL